MITHQVEHENLPKEDVNPHIPLTNGSCHKNSIAIKDKDDIVIQHSPIATNQKAKRTDSEDLISLFSKSKKSKFNLQKYTKMITYGCIIAITIVSLMLFYKSEYGQTTFNFFNEKLIDLLNYDRLGFNAIFFVFHFIYNLTFLPGHTYFFLLQPYLLKDLWVSFLIIFISYECSVIAGYFGIKFWFYESFKKKFQDDYRLKMIKDSVSKNPIMYGSLVWMIVIPDIMKMICLTLADVSFVTYF